MAGKAGRSGRKPKVYERAVLQIFDTEYPLAARCRHIRKMSAAVDDDSLPWEVRLPILKLLLAYSIGKPREVKEVHRSGHEVIEIHWQASSTIAGGGMGASPAIEAEIVADGDESDRAALNAGPSDLLLLPETAGDGEMELVPVAQAEREGVYDRN